jgi:replication initiation and membrane attachment protein DnaB
MRKITQKVIKQWFAKNGLKPRHNIKSMKEAINKASEDLGADTYDLLLLLVANEPIDSMHTHSYGFHTSNGRYIIELIQDYYNQSERSDY